MTASGTTADLDHLARFRAEVRGRVLTPDDHMYDDARRAWNLNADHRPTVVVLAADAGDVQRAVRFARAADLGVGVLATGHGTGATCDGGLLINTSRMRAISIDPEARVATVAAGAIWDDVVRAAAEHGLAGLPGSSTTVGVVGYTLGGGFGWLGRRYGLAAHSVTGAEVVTADGELIATGPDEHPKLFWALRGGTGNFGIVTSLSFALYPVPTVYAGNLYYPLDRARDLLKFFAGWSRLVPDELSSAITFRRFPPLPAVPEQLRGTSLVALRGCFCGDPIAGKALIDEARAALGPAAIDTFAILPTADLASVSLDPVDPLPALNHAELLGELTPAAIDALVALAGPDARSPLVMLEVRQLGGALAGSPDALSPMAHTAARFSMNAIGVTPDPAQAQAVRDHLGRVAAGLRPHVTGDAYLNFIDLDAATPDRVRAAYSERDWDRLVRLKARYDPDHVFRFNRNIPPTPTAHSAGK